MLSTLDAVWVVLHWEEGGCQEIIGITCSRESAVKVALAQLSPGGSWETCDTSESKQVWFDDEHSFISIMRWKVLP